MIVKAYSGDGSWELFEAERISFLGQGSAVEVPEDDHAFHEDGRFPLGWSALHFRDTREPHRPDPDSGDVPFRLMRWVMWFDPHDDECHLLVTDGPVYICNDSGDTVEALGR